MHTIKTDEFRQAASFPNTLVKSLTGMHIDADESPSDSETDEAQGLSTLPFRFDFIKKRHFVFCAE